MRTRGIQQLHDPRVTGAIVGAVGGSAFVLVNRGGLPGTPSLLALMAWVLALAAWAFSVLLLPRSLPPLARPAPRAGLVYGAAVLGMLVLIVVSARVLDALERPDLVPAAVVLAVGLHFLPFARAFVAPVFGVLGLVLACVAVVGLGLGAAGVAHAGSATAVVAGLVMLVLIAADARRSPEVG